MASDADNAELIPGYRILSLIGRGGMGAVYRAVKQSIAKEVALKVLLPSVSEDPVTSARFDREVRALARMRHPGLVNVVDAGVHGPYRYLVMDLVDGTDLETLVADSVRETGHGLEPGTVLDIADQVLAALEYIHAQGMVHRDLKPANLLLDRDGRVLLCDLGLVRIADEDSKLTQRLMLGTPEYVSPEQVRGASDLDIRSDLYSLGATLFYLLTGRPLFAAETPMATAQAHLHERAPALSALSPSTPPRLKGLVERLLHKQRERRFQTPREARVWLREFANVRRRRRRLLAAVAVIPPLLLAWMAFRPHGRPPAGERAPVAVEDAIAGELMWIEASMRDCRELLGRLRPGDPERREIERDLAAVRERYARLKQRMERR